MGQDVPNKLNIININEDLIKMKELLTEAESLLEEDEIESASLLIAQAEDISENWPDELLERVDVQLVNQQIKELIEDAESLLELFRELNWGLNSISQSTLMNMYLVGSKYLRVVKKVMWKDR